MMWNWRLLSFRCIVYIIVTTVNTVVLPRFPMFRCCKFSSFFYFIDLIECFECDFIIIQLFLRIKSLFDVVTPLLSLSMRPLLPLYIY